MKPNVFMAESKLVIGDSITDNLSRSMNLSANVALADGAVGPAQANRTA